MPLVGFAAGRLRSEGGRAQLPYQQSDHHDGDDPEDGVADLRVDLLLHRPHPLSCPEGGRAAPSPPASLLERAGSRSIARLFPPAALISSLPRALPVRRALP